MTPDNQIAELKDLLFRGICWLGSEQPADAIITQFGIQAYPVQFADLELNIGLGPGLTTIGPRAVFVLQSRKLWTERTGMARDQHLYEPFTAEHVRALKALIAEIVPIYDGWGGAGVEFLSISPNRELGPDILRCYDNYRANCPVCRNRMAFCCCDYFRIHRAELIAPLGWE